MFFSELGSYLVKTILNAAFHISVGKILLLTSK